MFNLEWFEDKEMNVKLNLIGNKTIAAKDSNNLVTIFDASEEHGGNSNGSSPIAILLEAMAACSFMDVLDIIKKKRKTVEDLSIDVSSERAEEHPKVYTKVHLDYVLKSPDAELKDLERAIELSQTKYCSASAMFQQAGCEVTWSSKIVRD